MPRCYYLTKGGPAMEDEPIIMSDLSVLDSFLAIDHEQQFTDAFFSLLELGGPDLINEVFGDIVEFEDTPSLTLNERVHIRIPDAILATNEKLLMVEVKTGADQSGTSQLKEEKEDLQELPQDTKALLYLTHHRQRPESAERLNVPWLNWYDVDTRVQHTLTNPETTTEISRLLHNILQLKGYIGFTGMDTEQLGTLTEAYPARENVLESFVGLANSVTGQLGDQFEIRGPSFRRNLGRSDTYSKYLFCIFDTPAFRGTSETDARRKANQSYAFLLFDESDGTLKIGVSLRVNTENTEGQYKFNDEIRSNWSEIINLVESIDGSIATSDYWRRRGVAWDDLIDPTEHEPVTNSPDSESEESKQNKVIRYGTRRVNLYKKYSPEALADSDVANKLANQFFAILKFIEDTSG